MYETKADMYNAALKNQDVAKYFENARAQFEEQMKEDYLVPLRTYQGQFAEVSVNLSKQKKHSKSFFCYNSNLFFLPTFAGSH